MNLRRMVIEFEVLYDADAGDDLAYFDELGAILEETIGGHASGDWHIASNEQVTKEHMAELLEAQGSDPDFLLGEDEDAP